MRGLQANDRLPALAADGLPVTAEAPPTSGRGIGVEPALPPIVAALASVPEAAGPLWVAVPSRLSTASMAALLRELRAGGGQVQGFVDSAVAVCAWIAPEATALTLDMGQHGAGFSVVMREGDDYRLRRSAPLPVGAADLFDGWIRLLAESMVRQWRFDPLHDPVQEQRLRAQLPTLLAAAEGGAATLELPVGDRLLQVTLSRDQFAAVAATTLRPLADTLQGLCAALGDCHLFVPADLARWPGMREVLALAGSRPLSLLAPEAAARAASLLPPSASREPGAVQYLTQLAAMRLPVPEDLHARQQPVDAEALPPTHLVHRGRAIAIDAQGLVLGRDPGEDAAVLQLPEGIAGLSRRHCTLRRIGSEVVLVDHSRHGSFIDGRRVNGRALLAAGNVLRLGTPGIELQLVAVGGG